MRVLSMAPRLAAVASVLIVVVASPASPASAAAPLPTPATPVATDVTTTSVAFAWSAPAGPVAGYTIQLIDGYVPWRVLTTTTATSYTHTGLLPDKVYQYRIIADPVPGSGYTASAPSGTLSVRTGPLPDAVPPTTPGTPFATVVSTIRATIHFAGATDNNRVAGYWVQRQVDGVWTDWSTNNISTVYLPDLTPGTTYTVVAVAFDANGNRSPQSPPFTFTTRQLEPLPACQVSLTQFGQQYQVGVTVENMTAATVLEDWTVGFSLPAAHEIGYAFSATFGRDQDVATATPMTWFATLPPGGAASFGFMATYPAGSPLPSDFVLQGSAGAVPCSQG